LILAYEPSSHPPLRLDALWRATVPAADDRFLAALDLIISVRTQSLDIQPESRVQSILPQSDVLRLHSVERGFIPLALPAKTPLTIAPDRGVGCLLFRITGTELSYCEMIHPADFQSDEVSRSNTICLAHRLFSARLEKGVILRARVRGVILNRLGDAEMATQCYAAFAAAEPPLST
jgi:hypothetical protein